MTPPTPTPPHYRIVNNTEIAEIDDALDGCHEAVHDNFHDMRNELLALRSQLGALPGLYRAAMGKAGCSVVQAIEVSKYLAQEVPVPDATPDIMALVSDLILQGSIDIGPYRVFRVMGGAWHIEIVDREHPKFGYYLTRGMVLMTRCGETSDHGSPDAAIRATLKAAGAAQ